VRSGQPHWRRLPHGQSGKTGAVSSGTPRPPDCISLDAHRDHPHRVERAARWVLMTALGALVVAALANVFGQRHVEVAATGGGARLDLTAPAALRSGLLFQGRFRVSADSRLQRPVLVLDPGWFDAISVNAVVPEPASAWSEGGRVAFAFPPLPAGRTMTVYLDLQVNPTTTGRRSQGLELRDGSRTITTIDRTVTVFP
jgi:hypothetical protein